MANIQFRAGGAAESFSSRPPPGMATCFEAREVCSGAITGSTVEADSDSQSCAGGARDVWYAYRPAQDGMLDLGFLWEVHFVAVSRNPMPHRKRR